MTGDNGIRMKKYFKYTVIVTNTVKAGAFQTCFIF